MQKFLIAVAPLALLSACSGGGSDGLQAGEWTMTTQMTEIDIPSVPEEMVAQMREQANAQPPNTICLSDEDVTNPVEAMFMEGDMGEDCDFGESAFEGGVINVDATCQATEGPGTTTFSMQGSYTATSMEAEITGNVEGGPMEMRIASTMTAERSGDCEAETQADS
ncbi:DUF3617 domain-containing protein [Parasphingopyxis algicola]|uniref:DUF3617 domain-containing protein n=1 Tax=Parasphingopyxis algicola TaxID=2026624 RepID=UPI0015A2CBA4|nr:DUF3617 domain-containing protein [Parasphingopyxis algicola]QLC25838.1 DUF3617 domain-containing protein [Parasphingopyxis algicola]